MTASHNRKKEYILQEGENIPALVDLGVFTPEFKIVKAKYDKYKQINRFIELVDDAFRAYGRGEITILDFGAANRTSRSCCTTISPSSAACAPRSSAMT